VAARGVRPEEGAPGPAVVVALWRAIDVLRAIALGWAAWVSSTRVATMDRPWLAWVVLGVLAAWTAAMFLHHSRTAAVVGTELALAVVAVLATRWVDPPEVITAGARTVPGIWPAAAVVAWSVLRGWRGGLLAAAVVAAADLVEVVEPTENTVNNIILLLLLGGCVGYCADLSREGHAALREAIRLQAQVRERDRLARTVHDGVLQTLSYIHRRGTDMGGGTRELAVMAAEQERLLRTLVSGVSARPAEQLVQGAADLRTILQRHAEGHVQVVAPADPVMLGHQVAEELSAVVREVLDNVRRHAGDAARAWVLIEDHDTHVVVTVRDDGVGVAPGRFAEAAAAGRMGVSHSIHGRMNDLGGRAVYDSSRLGGGTTVELVLPKRGRV
jgi:signal transduction histidine kinase